MSGHFDYSVFGLRLRSAVELPELRPGSSKGEPDITVHFGDAVTDTSNEGVLPIEGGAVLTIAGIGRYSVVGGAQILVQPHPDALMPNVRLYLLGSALGLLIHQRGLLPLHANAVEIDGRAFAFMGPSGSGKSTLAAWFHDQGCRVITDDVCVVGFDDAGQPIAWPGLPRLRLWRDMVEGTGRDTKDLQRSYAGDDDYEKYDVPISDRFSSTEPAPLGAIYLLDRAEELRISALIGLEAAEAIIGNTYRGEFLRTLGKFQEHWDASVRLARSVPVFRCARQWDSAMIGEQATAMLEHAASIGQAPLS